MDEYALIQDALQGSVEAFNTLILTYQSAAYNLAYRLIGDSGAAADATQEAFISAFKNLGQYRGGSFKAWLFRIVTNASYDEMRSRKRRSSVSIDDMTGESGDQDADLRLSSDPDDSPESLAMRSALNQAIQECLDTLPRPYKVVAILCDVQGYDYQEIASTAQISLGTVKSRLSRARERLRDCLQAAGELLPTAYRLSAREKSGE